MVREPAVAGRFYPGDAAVLRAEVEALLGATKELSAPPSPGLDAALVVPHAGYIYSGGVAGATYAAARLPRDLVILCPNHTGDGEPIAVMNRGGWRTPLETAEINEALADRVLAACPQAQVDAAAHRREHSLEVQLPFLQLKLREVSFVPICVGTTKLSDLTALGLGLAEAIGAWPDPVSIIISSDMSHYITAEKARAKDMLAIEKIQALDPEGLHRVVDQEDISMCGFAPAVAGLTAAKKLGAKTARLISYANSGEVSGDHLNVVGYAGLAIA